MVIMIVDDIEINRKLLKVGLEAEGYSTLLAEDGMEALKFLEKEKVDLIISDILMPNMDGYLLCHEVRTNERLRNIPFIIYSSTYTSPGDMKLGEKLGADKYLTRPAPTKEIVSAIQELTKRPYSFRPDVLKVKDEYFVMKEYSQLVVEKLEEQNKRLDITTRQLEAANQELEAFCYSVSHDLKAPLRSIDGFSAILLEHCTDRMDDKGRDCLSRIRASTLRMAQLIDDLLNLSRVTRTEIKLEDLDLSGLARSVLEGLKRSDPERQVEFVAQEGIKATGDARLLKIALENLLGNAWKFTSKHPKARIEFGSTEDEGKRVYFIRDDGAGFDMEYADKLFGAFQRLHNQSEFAGTGIGLSIVQRIIHRHGGRIWAQSGVEKGTTFYFTL